MARCVFQTCNTVQLTMPFSISCTRSAFADPLSRCDGIPPLLDANCNGRALLHFCKLSPILHEHLEPGAPCVSAGSQGLHSACTRHQARMLYTIRLSELLHMGAGTQQKAHPDPAAALQQAFTASAQHATVTLQRARCHMQHWMHASSQQHEQQAASRTASDPFWLTQDEPLVAWPSDDRLSLPALQHAQHGQLTSYGVLTHKAEAGAWHGHKVCMLACPRPCSQAGNV